MNSSIVIFKRFCAVAVSVAMVATAAFSVHAATTQLATEPISSSSGVSAKPNIMFVLDDSGSMGWDYLPDWAGPYQATVANVLSIITPAYRFFNSAFNGVAYNPGTRYQPPTMYNSAGAVDAAAYPSMTGVSALTGGDASATSTVPNWRAVKVDGYGIQSVAAVNLEGAAFSYTTIAGEYCDSVQLRNCIAASAPTGSYKFPARLRWCTTSTKAIDTTVNAGTSCQASNIDDSPTNLANGVTSYTFARIARQRTSTLTVGAPGTVSGITVDGLQILSASASGTSSTDLAADIVLKINACTYATVGTCAAVGYSAESSANAVVVRVPGATTSAPVVTGGGAVVATAFSGGSVPGVTLFSVITPSVTSYPYPGSATKSPNRTDCAGTACTYAEEMTNYANWYTYYRTRMQMMKTSASIAFSTVDDSYRVGYFSINNGAGNQYLNLAAFDGTQKNLWYSKFFSAVPYGATPLRKGLASAGRLYAGKLSSLNNVSVQDPVQYSCQQNFTILSTDGYWNDTSNPVQIDGATEVGQQDGNLSRPYYDGTTYTKTISQTLQSFQQKMMNTFFVDSRTSQLQTSTSRLLQAVTTTKTEPWKLQNSQLQARVRPLEKSVSALEKRTYPLQATTKVLRENTFNPQSTTRPLERSTYRLNETTTTLQKTITNITQTTYPLQVGTETVNYTTYPLQVGTETVSSITSPLQVGTEAVNYTTYALQVGTETVSSITSPLQVGTEAVNYTTYALQVGTETVSSITSPLQVGTETVYSISSPLQVGTETVSSITSPLQKTTYALESVNYQLQKSYEVFNGYTEKWEWTIPVNVTSGSCSTVASNTANHNAGIGGVQCTYVFVNKTTGLSTCSDVSQSTSSPYTALTANSCSYATTPTVAATGSCNVVSRSLASPYSAEVACGYGSAGAQTTVSSCSAKDQTGAASMSGDKVVCGYNAISWVAATGSPKTCTPSTPANYGGSRISCQYGTAGSAATVSSCAANSQLTTSAMTGDKVVCGYNAISWADATDSPKTCTPSAPTNYGGSRISCQYGTAGSAKTVSSCTANSQATTSAMTGDKVVCSYNAISWVNATGSPTTCTPSAPANYGGSRITCQYSGTSSGTVTGACTANSQSTTSAMTGDKVVCGYNAISWAAATGSPKTCTPSAPANFGGARISCQYGAAGSAVTVSSCAANDQLTTSPMTGDKVVCGYNAISWVAATGSPKTCTPSAPLNYGGSRISCQYSATASGPTTGACTANSQLTTSAMTGDKVVCGYNAISWAAATGSPKTCTPSAPANFGGARISCQYGAAGSAVTVSSCAANDQLTTSAMTGDKVVCSYNPISWSTASGSPPTCTPSAPASFGGSRISCGYGTTGNTVTGACVPNSQPTNAAMTGNQVVCGYNGVTWTNATGSPPTCTPNTPASFGGSRISCRYDPTASSTLAGQTSCAAWQQATTAAMSGNRVTCAYDATAASSAVDTSCTWSDSATAATPRTTCAYNTATATTAIVDDCTVQTQGTVTTNTTTWSGPAKACAYRAALVASGLTAGCSRTGSPTVGSPSPSSPYHTYSTCAYGSAAVTSAASCTEALPESGPDFSGGATVSCAYPATPTSTSAATSSCSWVGPSSTWATPVKTCTYDTALTNTVSACTNITEGTNGSGTYSGPATVCAYSTTPSATSLNASSCTASRQTASPYTAATAVDCSFNATPSVTTVTSCTDLNESGPAYTGAKIQCGYNASFGAWSDVTSGGCSAADQSAATGPTYGVWRECRYDSRADTYAGTCSAVAASTGPNYTVSNPVTCVAGSYVVSSATTSSTVDSCNPGTATTGNVNGTPPSTQIDIVTGCNYETTPTVANATSCVTHLRDATPPFSTEVTCPYTTGPWVRATTTAACVPVGTQPPPASMAPADFVGGKNVECRTTEPALPSTGTAANPVPDPSCTPGPVYIDSTTKVQTNCVYSINTTPTPVDPTSCNQTIGTPSGPTFIKEICTTTTPSTTTMGCTSQGPTSPLWQTVTCIDNGDGPKNTLADVAAYYYGTDLRTPALGNCSGATVSPATSPSVLCSTTDAMNNVRTSANDTNAFQHMVTYTLGLGASGYMKYSDSYSIDTAGDFPTVKGVSPYDPINGISASPSTGVCSWQATGLCNWPVPGSDEQTTIDDLWHAGVNGHGAYYSAGDPASLSAGISSALTGVAGAGGTISAPAASTANLSKSDNYLFSSSYVTSDWVGDLVRYRMDPYTGRLLPTVDWSAQAKLDTKASRTIYTFDSSVAVTKLKAFTSANYGTNSYFNKPYISTAPDGLSQFLCATSDVCLSATDQDTSHAAGANLVDYLQGVRTNEGATTDNTKYYRLRQHLLGDMVNAPTVYVAKPTRDYLDPGYSAFKSSKASRQAMVYAGSNDGMLHAFAAKGSTTTEAAIDAYAAAYETYAGDPTNAAYLTAVTTAATTATAALGADTTIGQELWAYIPSVVLPNLYKLADKKYASKHRYFIDGPMVQSDVCVSDCTLSTAVWKTILVSGLGRGGRSYFALDVTDPSNPKALWEFTDADLGYSYGNPQVTKLADGTWVVMIASGYNNIPNDDGSNGDGVGRLYVLNAATGVQVTSLSPISTGYGGASAPGGLSNLTAMVEDPSTNNQVLAVYGGDLGGNLWRFDVNNTVGASGFEAQLLAVLKDGSGNRQPITTKPTVTLIKNQKVVFVGTGRFLDTSDANDTSQQSMYAIKDPWTTGTVATTAIYDNPGGTRTGSGLNANGFVKQVFSWVTCPTGTSSGICNPPVQVMTATHNAVDFATGNGWFFDFINTSERLNTNPALGLGMLALVTNAPSLLACDVGGKSYMYFLDYLTGSYITSLNNPGGVAGYQLANSFASAPTIIVRSTPSGGTGTPVLVTVVQDASKYVGPGSSGNTPSTGSGAGSTNPCVGSICTNETAVQPNISPMQRSAWRELLWE